MTKTFGKRIFALLAILSAISAGPLLGALKTPVERADHKQWTPHARVAEFLTELEEASPLISKHLLGTSEEGREIFYAQVTADETFGKNDEKLKVLIYGQQHGAEPSGNDAILTLLRDFAAGKNLEWLEQMDLLVIPQVNPDGAETLQRRNAADVDLNRSHLILNGKEVRHLRDLFHEWEPEVALDVHEYQPWAQAWLQHGYMRPFDVQFGLPTNLNVPAAIRDLAENRFLHFIGDHLESAGFSHHNYTVGNPDSIRYSTSNINDGRQGLAILGTFSLILEGRRERDNRNGIAHRTTAQAAAIGGLLQFVAENKDEVARAVRDSRKQLREGRVPEFVLTMSRAGNGEPLRLPVREVHRNDAGDWEEGEIVTAEIENYFPLVVPERKTTMPNGYILPAAEQAAIDLLQKHRVDLSVLEGGERFAVEQFRIDGFVEEVFENATTIPTGSLRPDKYTAKAGDVYVPTSQLRGLMIATALEAQSMHGLIHYDAFSHWKQEGDFPILRVVQKHPFPQPK